MVYYGGSICETDTNRGNEDKVHPFFINCCGYIKMEHENASINRTRLDYYLIYLINGTGHYLYDNEMRPVSAGHIVIYPPFEKQNYFYLGPEKAELYWIHFTGTEVSRLLNSLGLSGRFIHKVGMQTECINLFEKIIQEIHVKNPQYHMLCIGYLMQLLSLFSRESEQNENSSGTTKDRDIETCIRKMQMEYQENHDIGYYAQSCGLSVYQFIRKFKSATRLTPARYIEKIRVDKSKELITDTDLTIGRISDIVGFSDPFYFSKVFKKATGVNPLLFKKLKA